LQPSMAKCQTCGATGSHWTRDCPNSQAAYVPLVTEIDPTWSTTVRDLDNPEYRAWLQGPNKLVKEELRNLKAESERLGCDIELEGAVKALMQHGWWHGPYRHAPDGSQAQWKDKWTLRIQTQHDGRVCFLRNRMAIHVEDMQGTLRTINAKNFFTSLTPEGNMLKKIGFAIQDSTEWQECQSISKPGASYLAKRVQEVFPAVEYRRQGIIEVFIARDAKGRQRRDEDVYRFIAEELRREDRAATGQHGEYSSESDRHRQLLLVASHGAPHQVECKAAVLQLGRNPDIFRTALLQSELAAEVLSQGVEIEPAWAKGAKILLSMQQEDVPAEIDLRPYYVFVKVEDMSRFQQVLASLPCKQRPIIKRSNELELPQHSAEEPDEPFRIVGTFIHYHDPALTLTPRSDFTLSCNDAAAGHVNPRVRMRTQPRLSTDCHLQQLQECQRNLELPEAVRCFSSMQSAGMPPTTQVYSILIDICAKIGDSAEAERFFLEMRDKLPTPPPKVAFNCLINAFAKVANGPKAVCWFHAMRDAGFQPDLIAYNCLIRAFSGQGCVEQAREWFHAAQQQFGTVDITSYRLIMKLYASKGMASQVEAIFDEMDQGAQGHDERGLLPCDAQAYRAVIAAYANAGDVDNTRLWCQKKEENGFGAFKVFEYTHLLKACAPQKDRTALTDKACDIFIEQLNNNVCVDHNNLEALSDALGQTSARAICKELGVDTRAANLSRLR